MTSSNHPPACICLNHPLPAGMSVRDARDAYLAENGFTMAAYDSPTTSGSLFGVKIAVPNPPSHRRAIKLHDLHHVATGYGTDHVGEAELSAWQARLGLRRAGLYVGAIVGFNVLVGALFAPHRTLAALRGARHHQSLFALPIDYDALLHRTVGELRTTLGIPTQGLARAPRKLHAHAPSPLSSSS